MRKLLLAVGIILLVVQVGAAQKYKVKRRTGTVLKDKEEVARVEGKVSVFRRSNMDMYQNDELVLSLKEKVWKSPYKEFDNIVYYSMDFPKLGESFHINAGYTFTNEKQIVKLLMAENGLHIYKDGFKQEEIDKLKNSEAVQSVENDTLKYQQLLADWRSAILDKSYKSDEKKFDKITIIPLHSDPEKRPKNLPSGTTHLVYRKITDYDLIKAYEIEEKSIYRLLGSISYKNHVAQTGQMKATNEIRIFRRVKTTIEYNGEKTRYAPIAYTDIEASGLNDTQGEGEYILYLDDSIQEYIETRYGEKEDLPFKERTMRILKDLEEKELI